MPLDSRGDLFATVLGTGVAMLWCVRSSRRQQPRSVPQEPPRQQADDPMADAEVETDDHNPDHILRVPTRVDAVQDLAARRAGSNEMMIMSSPRRSPTATYSDLGVRNSRETPGFLQNVVGAPDVSSQRFSIHEPRESEPLPFDETDPALAFAAAQRRLLPKRIILVRHGESEANADHSLLRYKPDNLIELTAKGSQQALAVGKRIKQVVGDEKVCLVVSPFERTLQTSRNLRLALDESQIVKTSVEPRLREQVLT